MSITSIECEPCCPTGPTPIVPCCPEINFPQKLYLTFVEPNCICIDGVTIELVYVAEGVYRSINPLEGGVIVYDAGTCIASGNNPQGNPCTTNPMGIVLELHCYENVSPNAVFILSIEYRVFSTLFGSCGDWTPAISQQFRSTRGYFFDGPGAIGFSAVGSSKTNCSNFPIFISFPEIPSPSYGFWVDSGGIYVPGWSAGPCNSNSISAYVTS